MKLTQIALALAAISAAPAFAVDITIGGTPPVSGGIPVIYISGASALSGTFGTAVGALCAVPLVKYIDNKDGKQTAAYLCNNALVTSGFGTGVDKFIAVKRDEDGSFAGVGPVIQKGYNANGIDAKHSASPAGGLNFMDLKNCTTGTTPLTCVYTPPFTTGQMVPGLIVPDAGLTDVETNIWKGRGQFPFPAPAPDITLIPTTFKTGFAAQGFGIAVTEELYKAMQTKALADGDLEAPCVVGDFTAACQPSISRAQYTSIASQSGGYHTDWSPILGASGGGQAVNLCRRVKTSGTQASSDTYFLSNPCANANPTFGLLAPAEIGDSAAGAFHVSENSSTGNVKNCLNYHNNGFDNTTTGPNAFISNNEATEGKFAIGVVSLENLPAAGTGPIVSGPASAVAAGDKWKFVELSDVSPNLDANQRQTAIDGDYDFAFEFEALWRNEIGAPRITFMNALVNELGNPGGVNLRGIYTVPGTFDNATFPTLVGKGSRFGNSCQPLQLF